MIIARPSTIAATLLASLLFAAPSAAQDPPAPTPPQVTCADWGSYPFFELASPDTVFACIAAGADPGAPVDMYRGTPLHHAARAVSDSIVINLLLSAGADVNARDRRDRTPLHEAARANPNPGVIAALLAAGAEVNARDLRGATPLHEAVRPNPNPQAIPDPEAVASPLQVLLEAGADIDARDDRRDTPLHRAWQNPSPEDAWSEPWREPRRSPWLEPRINAEAAGLLLAAGADPLARNQRGEAADPGVCENWHLAVFARVASPADYAACAEGGYDPGARDEHGHTVLHHAAANADAALVHLLLEAGADASVPGYNGHTPLHFALRHRNDAVAAALVRAGADVNAAADGITPLLLAAYDESVTTLLLEAGAALQAVGSHGEAFVRIYSPVDGVTPLHEAAASNRNPAVLSALVRAGAEVNAGRPPDAGAVPIEHAGTFLTEIAIRNITDPGQTSPLHLAALRNRNPAVIEALVALGADLEVRGRDGRTALHMAARGNAHAFLALLALGADDTAVDGEGLTPWDYAKDNRSLHGLPEVRRLREEEAKGAR